MRVMAENPMGRQRSGWRYKLYRAGRGIQRNWGLYLLLLPAVVLLFCFTYLPMYGVQIAFRDFSPSQGIQGSPWVGLANFQKFFNSFQSKNLIWNTVSLSLYSLIPYYFSSDGQPDPCETLQAGFASGDLSAPLYFHSGYGGHNVNPSFPQQRNLRKSGPGAWHSESDQHHGRGERLSARLCVERCVATRRLGQHYLHCGAGSGGSLFVRGGNGGWCQQGPTVVAH